MSCTKRLLEEIADKHLFEPQDADTLLDTQDIPLIIPEVPEPLETEYNPIWDGDEKHIS